MADALSKTSVLPSHQKHNHQTYVFISDDDIYCPYVLKNLQVPTSSQVSLIGSIVIIISAEYTEVQNPKPLLFLLAFTS